jgi:DNA-binding transcriptional ArsR family regulator
VNDARSGADTEASAASENSPLVEQANLVFTALADPTRRQVLQLLAEGPPLSASALAGHLPISRQAVVQHLAVLQQSELVSSRRSGREVLFSVRPEALSRTASWMNTLAESWSERLLLLKRIAEAPNDRSRDAQTR